MIQKQKHYFMSTLLIKLIQTLLKRIKQQEVKVSC